MFAKPLRIPYLTKDSEGLESPDNGELNSFLTDSKKLLSHNQNVN